MRRRVALFIDCFTPTFNPSVAGSRETFTDNQLSRKHCDFHRCADICCAVWRYTQSTRASNRDLLYDQWDQFKQFAAYLQRIEVNEDAATADEEQSPDEPQPKKERKSKRKGESAAKNKAKKQSKGVLAEDDTEAKPRKKRKK
jgi:hypothetical protein